MENQEHLLPLRREQQQPNDPQVERATAFGKEVIGITGSAIVAGVSGYKDIAKGVSLLFRAGGFSLLITFVSAVVLMHFQMHLPPGARHSRCTDLSSTVLVSLTSVLLVATNGMFVALMNKDNTVPVILVLPVVLVLGMRAGADFPPGDAAAAQEEAYEEAMKSNAELASFGATAAFAIEGALLLGYLKYPSLNGCSPTQVDLAVASFASTVSVLAMTVTALPVRTLFPSAQARLVAVAVHLKCAMLAALISMSMILAVEFLQWWFMLSLFPEAIAVALNVAIMAWTEGGATVAAGHGGANVDSGEAAAAGTRERMAKGFRTVATMNFTLMAGTYAVYLGHKKYDVYLRAAMFVMLAAIVSSLRQMLRPFELDGLPRARGWWAVAVGAVSLVFPGLALVIAMPLLVKIFVHFYFGNVN
ncbi:hypothetical protein E2562_021161 [Oryza meyeriana var. granulata]|uniref:Uncharacterized protein n=1 Tax=Oryza meyeriana var. granulata TaxID=110450 RepID=A0A6G1DZJ1_9ORYZ|nr:hypothetical protein E2562_021161 [Oryza meyeriana var. granulata]